MIALTQSGFSGRLAQVCVFRRRKGQMAIEGVVSVDAARMDTINADPFGDRLRAARLRHRWSQKELARRAGVATKDIIHFEEGFSRPSFDRLRRLANTLEVSTDYLLGIVVAPDVEIGDALYRAVGQLTDEDRELAKSFLKVLVENSVLRRRKKQSGAAATSRK